MKDRLRVHICSVNSLKNSHSAHKFLKLIILKLLNRGGRTSWTETPKIGERDGNEVSPPSNLTPQSKYSCLAENYHKSSRDH
jgi:hypothetical protein